MATISASQHPCFRALLDTENALKNLVQFSRSVEEIIDAAALLDFSLVLILLQRIRDSGHKFSQAASSAINHSIACVKSFLSHGGPHMPCATTHSGGKVQGAGLCCAAVQSGQLQKPPPGTTFPVYTPGSAHTLPQGRIVNVTDAAGHCASCMIVGSASRKHPGKPVLKFIRGGPGCATAGTGCCAMAA